MDAKRELDADFVLVARTDARSAVGGGLGEAIRRGQAYCREADVDAVYFEGAHSRAELGEFVAAIRDVDKNVPIMAGTSAIDPPPPWEELQALGLAVAFYPGAGFQAANIAAWDYLHDFRQRGVQALAELQARTRGHPLAGFGVNDLVGFPALREREAQYLPAGAMDKYDQTSGVYTP
jgi:2-methylisocitrate lyase-like PEP mutase family enzyme